MSSRICAEDAAVDRGVRRENAKRRPCAYVLAGRLSARSNQMRSLMIQGVQHVERSQSAR